MQIRWERFQIIFNIVSAPPPWCLARHLELWVWALYTLQDQKDSRHQLMETTNHVGYTIQSSSPATMTINLVHT
ncbi:unnamed protein product [Tuber melanosporum]|uniref:(Perigord truffle) hypothetical protein n=1 Tax=Tuber melanosporum (strain Mel28) TaxID=656061 RepID=D5G6B8_TUBMM|nr:uncharacterized protein GSTUM_00004413001 [Tuber melanosporum]CAZ80061.1 unnamed protein product [Tuber melanosporum]